MNTLGETKPDPLSLQLGTGWIQFNSTIGCKGLAKVSGAHLHILAIESTCPGSGQFRSFITCAKSEFMVITIWEVWNEELVEVLKRYGFSPVFEETFKGEFNNGWRFLCPQPTTLPS